MSATKVLHVNDVSNKIARHSLAYLSVQNWFTGNVHYYRQIWPKVTNPTSKNADLQSIFALSA